MGDEATPSKMSFAARLSHFDAPNKPNAAAPAFARFRVARNNAARNSPARQTQPVTQEEVREAARNVGASAAEASVSSIRNKFEAVQGKSKIPSVEANNNEEPPCKKIRFQQSFRDTGRRVEAALAIIKESAKSIPKGESGAGVPVQDAHASATEGVSESLEQALVKPDEQPDSPVPVHVARATAEGDAVLAALALVREPTRPILKKKLLLPEESDLEAHLQASVVDESLVQEEALAEPDVQPYRPVDVKEASAAAALAVKKELPGEIDLELEALLQDALGEGGSVIDEGKVQEEAPAKPDVQPAVPAHVKYPGAEAYYQIFKAMKLDGPITHW